MNAPLPLNVTRETAAHAYETVAQVSNEVAGRLAARLAAETSGEVLFARPTAAVMRRTPRSTR